MRLKTRQKINFLFCFSKVQISFCTILFCIFAMLCRRHTEIVPFCCAFTHKLNCNLDKYKLSNYTKNIKVIYAHSIQEETTET